MYDILSAEVAGKSSFNESPDILKNKVPDGYAVVDRKRHYGGVVPIISGSIGRYHPYVHSREARIHAARVLGRNKGDVDQVSGSNENLFPIISWRNRTLADSNVSRRCQ